MKRHFAGEAEGTRWSILRARFAMIQPKLPGSTSPFGEIACRAEAWLDARAADRAVVQGAPKKFAEVITLGKIA